MHEWGELFKFTVTLLAIVNPIGGVPTFLSATKGWKHPERSRTARIVANTVFWVLAAAALFGTTILEIFRISIPSFEIGGGILLLMLAVSMLQARESLIRQTPEEAQEASDKAAVGVVPLGIPLLAGPGAISSVIIASHQTGGGMLSHLMVLIPIAVVAFAAWGIFLIAIRVADRLGMTGINIITRLMGLILAAVAVEFIYSGLVQLFPKLA